MNIYSCIDAILALKYNLVDLCRYSDKFGNKITLNSENSTNLTYRRNDVVVRASASQSVDLGFVSQVESYQKTYSFPAWHSANRDSVENKPAS